ncbi:MAG: TRAP transporter small permease [Campylobacterales bacterium]|nr:TRAP transporter small permease [Campylobacterales bacterium]
MIGWVFTLNRWLSKGGAVLSSVALIVLIVLILVEILGRSFFQYSTMIADEYSGYLYLSAVFFGLAYALNHDSHIRITIITAYLGNKASRAVDVFCGVLGMATMSVVVYYAWIFMLDTKSMEMVSEGVSQTPLYLTQIPVVVGSALLWFALFSFTLKRLCHDR